MFVHIARCSALHSRHDLPASASITSATSHATSSEGSYVWSPINTASHFALKASPISCLTRKTTAKCSAKPDGAQKTHMTDARIAHENFMQGARRNTCFAKMMATSLTRRLTSKRTSSPETSKRMAPLRETFIACHVKRLSTCSKCAVVNRIDLSCYLACR